MRWRWIMIAVCLALVGSGVFYYLETNRQEKRTEAPLPTSSGFQTAMALSDAPSRLKSYLSPSFEVNVIKDIVYANKKNETEAIERLKLDLYVPETDDHLPKPVFVFIHGGGYKEGSKRDAADFSTALAQRGYAVVSIDYRLKKDPDANMYLTLNDDYEDISDAIGWIREHSKEYGLDVGKLAIGGDSAGGHLAMNYVNQALNSDPDSVRSVFAIVDIYGGTMDEAIDGKLPPVLIIHGTIDTLIPYSQSVQLTRDLANAGIYSNFFTMEGAGHDYKNDLYKDMVIDTAATFLQNVNDFKGADRAPDVSSLYAVSGDAFKLKLPSAFQPSDGGSRAAVFLPPGWTLEGAEDEAITVRIPAGLERGSNKVFVTSDPGKNPVDGYAVNVNVIDPIKVNYETFYDRADGKVKTELTVRNETSQPFNGTLRVSYADRNGKENVFETNVEQLMPNISKAFTISDALSGKRILEVTTDNGVLTQQSASKANALLARHAGTQGSVDGKLDEWQGQTRFEADTVRNDSWEGEKDLSAFGYLSWDESNLYLAVDVTDDAQSQPGTGFDIWAGDSIQFAIGAAYETGDAPGSYNEAGIALGDAGQVLRWRWIATPGLAADGSFAPNAAVSRQEGETIYEASIPWEELGIDSSRAANGLKLKFSLLVNDNDGGGRKGWVEYNGGIGTAKDIHAFGDVFLTS